MWCISELDADYIRKMEDVLAVYEKPYNPKEPVVCLDEKPVSLHADLRLPIPAAPGKIARRDNEYQRCGVVNAFCAVEPKAGRHFTWPTPNRSGPQFARVIAHLVHHYPRVRTIHVVMDNLSSHSCKMLTDRYGKSLGEALWNRLTVHYTPTHGSWLNQAEIEISLFSRQCLGKRRIPSLAILRREARCWNRYVNRRHLKINWSFDRKAARRKFGYDKHAFTQSKT